MTLARTLQSPTVAERGIDDSAGGIQAVEAWNHHSRGGHYQAAGVNLPPACSPTYTDWAWVLNMAAASTTVRRIWPSPDHWHSPGYYEGAPAGPFAAIPLPWVVPWAPTFMTGTAPAGVDADLGCLIDVTDDGAEGWEILGMRKPSDLEIAALNNLTAPAPPVMPTGLAFLAALLTNTLPRRKPPAFRAGDLVADALHYRTLANSGRIEGRGAGKMPKRRGVITNAELDAGVIEHAISVTMMNFNHGPGGTCACQAPATRVEHPDRPPNRFTASLIGYVAGRTVHNGQAYAFQWNAGGLTGWLNFRGHAGQRRRTATTIGVAIDGYGIEGVETCGFEPQMEATLTPEQWRLQGVPDATVCTHLMDGIEQFGRWVAINPAPVYLAA